MEQQPLPNEFDERALAELREDLGDSFAEFVAQFIATAQLALDEIDAALRRGDADEVVAQAHSLRGTAGYLGAVAMCRALDALQNGAQHGGVYEDLAPHASQARAAFISLKTRWLVLA